MVDLYPGLLGSYSTKSELQFLEGVSYWSVHVEVDLTRIMNQSGLNNISHRHKHADPNATVRPGMYWQNL